MTETSPIASVGHIKSTLADKSDDELADLRTTVGLVAPGVEFRIISQETGDVVPWDGKSRGELQVAGRGSRGRTTTTSGRPSRSLTTVG